MQNILISFCSLLNSFLSSSGQSINNVILTIERHGLEGNIQVTWSTGLLVEGVVNGTLTPPTGTFFMGAGTSQLSVNFTVSVV